MLWLMIVAERSITIQFPASPKNLNSNLTSFQAKFSHSNLKMSTKGTPLHKLGENGPTVPALGFGLMGLTHNTYGTIPSEEEAFAILDRTYELGNRFWDTVEYISLL